MEAYRDQYAKLFDNGNDVVVIAMSVDPDTALASWARDESFPVLFASDSGGAIGRKYGVFNPRAGKTGMDTRVLYVIDAQGKVTYRAMPFRELVGSAYTELQEAVARTKGDS